MDKRTYDKMNNLNKSIFALAGTIAGACLKDDYWKLFGFKSCPKRGKYFEFLVNKDKLKKEDFILKEILLLSTIDTFRAICLKIKSEQDCKLYFIGLLSMIYNKFAKMHFNSERTFLDFFENGVHDYSVHNCFVAFSARAKEALSPIDIRRLTEGIHLMVGPDPTTYKEGIFLSLNVISENISTDISNDVIHFHSTNHMLKEFNIYAHEILRTLKDLDLQYSQGDFN